MSQHTMPIAIEILQSIVNSVFLPPKLPQKAQASDNARMTGAALLSVARDAAQNYESCVEGAERGKWRSVEKMLSSACKLQEGNSLSKNELRTAISAMQDGDVLMLHINAQNAGIIMRQDENQMLYEMFEVSPSAAKVIGTKGKLLCSYPGPAITVALDRAKDPLFIEELGTFLEQMDVDVMKDALPTSRKAGNEVAEERDSTDPMFITQVLTGILRALGKVADVPRICKRVADDVLWDNAKLPWRRSPLWLVVRVALQTTLDRGKPQGQNYSLYKAFMVFLLARLLELALKHDDFDSDTLFIMNAKLARRVYKMGTEIPDFVSYRAEQIVKEVRDKLDRRWRDIRVKDSASHSFTWNPQLLDVDKDTQLALNNSRSYLTDILNQRYVVANLPPFAPDLPCRIKHFQLPLELPVIPLRPEGIESFLTLADFEDWIDSSLDHWLDVQLASDDTAGHAAMRMLSDRINVYTSKARPIYASNGVEMSVMFLMTLTLWVALDRIALKVCHMLEEHSPEVPLGLMDPLLLPKRCMMERLHQIEQYIRHRHQLAKLHDNPSIFDEVATENSFSVRYFGSSQELSDLRDRIQRDARVAKEKRFTELAAKNSQYSELMTQASDMGCKYRLHKGHQRHDKRRCRRCIIQKKAKKLTVEPFEWPLPEDLLKCMNVVFELHPPPAFSIWRDVTFKVLHDICGDESNETLAQPSETFTKYPGLLGYARGGHRITIASTAKRWSRAHYAEIHLPATKEQICFNHALRYKLYDGELHIWATDPFESYSVGRTCVMDIPEDSPYHTLQSYVNGTHRTSNQVLAEQSTCPNALTLHEFIAFGSLRAGHRLQWPNIARELAARTLTFREAAVNILFTQAVWQAGPSNPNNFRRESHELLEEVQFGRTVLDVLKEVLEFSRDNWLEINTAKSVIDLATRLLSLATHDTVIQDLHKLIREARLVTLHWTQQIADRLQSMMNEDETVIIKLQLRALEAAALCRTTYNVDRVHLPALLNSDDDVATVLECAMVVSDNTPAGGRGLSKDLRLVLDRDRRLSHFLEPRLVTLIAQSRQGVDKSIHRIWSSYIPGKAWQQLPSPNDRWLITTTRQAIASGHAAQAVQLNLIDGQLLIDGSPLGRLPADFVAHETYDRMFGSKVLDVNPASMCGMAFETRGNIFGQKVFFALRHARLVIRTRRVVDAKTEIHELVPHEQFETDLPASFVEDYTHWIDLETGIVELRPLSTRWQSSSSNWHLHFSTTEASKMYTASHALVDITSPAYDMISGALKALEPRERIHVLCKEAGKKLSVCLPRFRLDFIVDDDHQLRSRQFRDMHVDLNQDIGTFYGLRDRLVLRHASPDSNLRTVIVPYGLVTFQPQDEHMIVAINTDKSSRVRFYQYHVDLTLDRLVGSSEQTSMYYRAYLHALTSSCLSDPLIGKTGTQEALDILQSAGALSFQKLNPAALDILRLIAKLSPKRAFYPLYLQVMQRVEWSRLPSLKQHEWFQGLVSSIIAHSLQMNGFQAEDMSQVPVPKERKSMQHLVDRALNRNAFFRTENYGGALSQNNEDEPYSEARDNPPLSQENNIFGTARLVCGWTTDLDTHPNLLQVLLAQGHVVGLCDDFSLHYDRKWLTAHESTLAHQLIRLFNWCRQCLRRENTYQLLFVLAAATHAGNDHRLIQSLLAFATFPAFQALQPPSYDSYHLSYGFQPDADLVLKILRDDCALQFERSSEYQNWSHKQDRNENERVLAEDTWKTNLASEIQDLTNHIILQWPSECVAMPMSTNVAYRLIDLTNAVAIQELNDRFGHWFRNMKLRQHITQIQTMLDSLRATQAHPQTPLQFAPSYVPPDSKSTLIQIRDLLSTDTPDLSSINYRHRGFDLPEPSSRTHASPDAACKLRSLLEHFASQHSGFRETYGQHLLQSWHAFNDRSHGYVMSAGQQNIAFDDSLLFSLTQFRDECRNLVEENFKLLHDALMLTSAVHAKGIMRSAELWPRIASRTLLRLLATNSSIETSSDWKRAIATYGRAITFLQQADRLLGHATRKEISELLKEASNKGGQYDLLGRADWLLIEIENNFLIRDIQSDIASEMITPAMDRNNVLQLNMGEGKSSVIVPIVSAALADGKKLVRVVVLKPLSSQMFQLLVQRLGGLANRRVFYLPFSRSFRPTANSVQQIQAVYEECMRIGGILLVQPEHILSFKLMGLEQLVGDGAKRSLADELLNSQRWLKENARDILDESDEILNVRYQLIYTMGHQRPVEAHPERWAVIQEVFNLVSVHATHLHTRFPDAVEALLQGPKGSFPHIRVLQTDVGHELLDLIVTDIGIGRLSFISFRLFPDDMKQLASTFIRQMRMPKVDYDRFIHYCKENGAPFALLLLLRGLIAHRIMLFVLKEKRWRVEYGLDKKRTMLAVPYCAKDIPTIRSEFGHPDVAIALTCLSYYYLGLTEAELHLCFERLFNSDSPQILYDQWIKACEVPDTLRYYSGINWEDPYQRSHHLVPLFSKNKEVVDFYLACFVFPKEAKEFPHKLSTSGWDLAEVKRTPTTGFSGTNDNRYLLPLSMHQRDLPEVQETNAKVLSYLLQPENNVYKCAKDENGERLCTEALLEHITDPLLVPPVHVLLDVGAQVLELHNQEVATLWLTKTSDPSIQAAVFFDEQDELMVIGRDENKEAFATSMFSMQMDACLVYLDEVHTRGTDLKLPALARAAVTLGPRLNKDKLVQACMRMRKLGHGQSVMFFAPPEVHKTILEVSGKSSISSVEAVDIIRWTLEETSRAMQINVAHWASQGFSYETRQRTWSRYCEGLVDLESLKPHLLESEAQTLKESYSLDNPGSETNVAVEIRGQCSNIRLLEDKCREFDIELDSLRGVRMREEQEREIEQEHEREQQMERPPRMHPLEHSLHSDVQTFVSQGKAAFGSPAFLPAFDTVLSVSGTTNEQVIGIWTRRLLVTRDFAQTIKSSLDDKIDDFLRPVRWILSSTRSTILVILSPFEANELLPDIRGSRFVRLHSYSPRVTKSMRCFDDLLFHCIPPLPDSWQTPDHWSPIVRQLNLFAGQLYLRDISAYQDLCSFLSLYVDQETSSITAAAIIQNDGFIKREYRRGTTSSPFETSPVALLQTIIGLRQKGQAYLLTHMGQILHSKVLTTSDF